MIELQLDEGATAGQAIEASGILKRYPEIDLQVHKVGVFGKTVALDQLLRSRDRVEIYRALRTDPKDSRRRRAAAVRKRLGRQSIDHSP